MRPAAEAARAAERGKIAARIEARRISSMTEIEEARGLDAALDAADAGTGGAGTGGGDAGRAGDATGADAGGRRARLCGCPVFYSRGLHFLNCNFLSKTRTLVQMA